MDTIHLPLTLLTKAPGPGLQVHPQSGPSPLGTRTSQQGNQRGPSGPSRRLLNPRSRVRLQSLPSPLGTSPVGPS